MIADHGVMRHKMTDSFCISPVTIASVSPHKDIYLGPYAEVI